MPWFRNPFAARQQVRQAAFGTETALAFNMLLVSFGAAIR
jgi:hypothetical protein